MSKKLFLACAALLAVGVTLAAIAAEKADPKSDCAKQCAAKECAKACAAKACSADKQCSKGCDKQSAATECAKAKECGAKQCAASSCAKECAAKECTKQCAAGKACSKACAKECTKACAEGKECSKACAKECAAANCTKQCAEGKECSKTCPKECTKACAAGKECTKACSAEGEAECKAKCPVSGKDADKSVAVDYKGGKVYLCCPGCPGAFKKNTTKYATKANHQLVVTGQAKQTECPITGGKLNPDTAIEVCGTKVCFCCNGCKGKVAKAEGDDQAALVFGDKAFAKGFKVKAKK